ncbi:MAG: hypothetical protein ACYT04_36140, partial [Nostoc sp.]
MSNSFFSNPDSTILSAYLAPGDSFAIFTPLSLVGSALGVSLFLVTWSSLPATMPNVFSFSILRIVSGDIKDLCYKC